MLTLILTGFFVLIVGIGALIGLARGLNKAVIRILTLAVAIVLTFVAAGPVTNAVLGNITVDGLSLGQFLVSLAEKEPTLRNILDASPLMEQAILAAPGFALSFVVLPVVFVVLSFLSWIVFLIVQSPLRRAIFGDDGQTPNAGKRFAGMGIGLVSGVLVFAMLMAPLYGVFSTLPDAESVDQSLDTLVQKQVISASNAQLIKENYGVTNCLVVRIGGKAGLQALGNWYLANASAIEADGYRTSLMQEFGYMMSAGQTALEGGLLTALLEADNTGELYAVLANKDMMDLMMQDLFRSRLLASVVPEIVAVAMQSVAKTMNVPADKGAVYDNMMDGVTHAVRSADIDYAAIHAYEQAHGTVYRMARSARSSDTMTQEEYEEQIQKLEELAATISSILDQSISGDTTDFADAVADHIVNELKNQAAQGGQQVADNYDIAALQDTLSRVDEALLDANLLQQLMDKEQFETDMATVETITDSVRQSVKDALQDETQAAETASTLASVVSDLAQAVSSASGENGELDVANLDFEKVASAVTSLQNSALKDVGASVLDIVVSGDLGDNALISDAVNAVKEGYENGENISGAITSAGALVNLGTAMGGGEGNQDNMVTSLTSLINNLDEFTINLLPSILTEDTIASMGVPQEHTGATYSVIETLLRELMALKGAADYDSEVQAILHLYNLATTGVEQFSKDDVAELADYAVNSDAIFNTLVSVSASNPFGIQIENENSRLELIQAIEENYDLSGKTQREREIYRAVATLLGLEQEVDLT